MPINRVQLNAIHNALKDLSGDRGGFILFLMSDDGTPAQDVQVRMYGPHIRLAGLLEVGNAVMHKHFADWVTGEIRKLPTEPD
jgi:hypothetical protein